MLLYSQDFYTVSSSCQHQTFRKPDIRYIDIFRNGSRFCVIYNNTVDNFTALLPFIFICSLINLKLRTVGPYFCHIPAVLLFSCFRVDHISCCSCSNIFQFLTIRFFQCLASELYCDRFIISENRAFHSPSIVCCRQYS